jgi:predicted ferric reductase
MPHDSRRLHFGFLVLFFVINLIIIFYIWWLGSNYSLTSPDLAGKLVALGKLSGFLAAYVILVQITLVGRLPWIEHAFGHDRMNKIHRWIGYSIGIFFLAHPLLLIFGFSSQIHVSFWEQFLSFLVNRQNVTLAFLGFLLFLVIIAISIPIIKKKLQYESWYFTHLLVYLAIFLIFGHQIVASDIARTPWILTYWYALNWTVWLTLFSYRFLCPLYRANKYKFVIDKVISETPDVNSVYITGKNIDQFRFNSGQFANLYFLQKGMWSAHPFSFSDGPNGKYLRFSIKGSGDFTSQILKLKPGTRVLIDGPLGVFTEEFSKRNKFLFIAGGIGITPLRALLNPLTEKRKNVVLLYACRTESDIAFRREIEALPITYR